MLTFRGLFQMYEFIDINQTPKNNPLSVRLLVNGAELSPDINFTTLWVNGRGAVNYDTESVSVALRDGHLFFGKALEPRVIEVGFMLTGGLRTEYAKLNQLLYQENLKISFSDDADFYLNAEYMAGKENYREVANNMMGVLTFVCHDPFYYAMTPKEHNATTITVNYPIMLPTRPVIELTQEGATFTLTNSTTGKRIELNGTQAGDVVKIDLVNNTIIVNNQKRLQALNFLTDFHTFTISHGDRLSANQGIKLTYNARRL